VWQESCHVPGFCSESNYFDSLPLLASFNSFSMVRKCSASSQRSVSLHLFKLPNTTYNHPLQSQIDMANGRKPAANAGRKPTTSTKENVNIQARSSTAARPTSAPKPLRTHAPSSNGAKIPEMRDAKDAETAALVASLRG
jgi:hypothetical protein